MEHTTILLKKEKYLRDAGKIEDMPSQDELAK